MMKSGSAKTPNAGDQWAGRQIRAFRISVGMSQELLASQLGITFQQLQKYENGVNRVSVGRLAQIASVLSVGIGEFFEGIVTAGKEPVSGTEAFNSDPIAIRMVKIWADLSPEVRSRLAALAETLAVQNRPAAMPARRRARGEARSLVAAGK